jgi:NDP-sugar pyrophosphorylase family protein
MGIGGGRIPHLGSV